MRKRRNVIVTVFIVTVLILCVIWALQGERYKLIHSISSTSATGPAIFPEDIQSLLSEPVWDEDHKIRLYTILYVEKQNSIHLAFDDFHIPAFESRVLISGNSEGSPVARSVNGIGNAYLGIVNASAFDWSPDFMSKIEKVEVYQRTSDIQDEWRLMYRFRLQS